MKCLNLGKRSKCFAVVVNGILFVVFAELVFCIWKISDSDGRHSGSVIDFSDTIYSYEPTKSSPLVSANDRILDTLHTQNKHSPFQHYSHSHNSSKDGPRIANADLHTTEKKFNGDKLPPCPVVSPILHGELYVETKTTLSFEEIEKKYNNTMSGGRYKPTQCKSNNRVAIIVPYRNRKQHLQVFLNHMHAFLQRQQLDYGIFVMELVPTIRFNRALLLNIGFVEASRHYGFDCFIFHDVDLLPENDRNLYTCSPQSPIHLSVAIDKFYYSLPYTGIFGGVSAMTRDQFMLLNGFSNKFFGWGGEDDDMFKRVDASGMVLLRYTPEIARYRMLKHVQEGMNPRRNALLLGGLRRWKTDGLNSLEYKVVTMEMTGLYTYILADIDVTDKAFLVSPADVIVPQKDILYLFYSQQIKNISLFFIFYLLSLAFYRFFIYHFRRKV